MPQPRTKTDTYQGITITVREPMGSDLFDAGSILAALPKEGERAARRRNSFTDSILLTMDISGLPFSWPDFNARDEDIRQAYDCWRQLDKNVLIFWANLIYDAAHLGADIDLLPKAAGEA